ncbi:VPLPA-CTERM-specific exosortase XrtD [Sneathiella sp. HT1-7]|jgi:exosortase D (VPLPA-CTERM-specific)|uniref:VPLPA-CTERM-specific exosortase XrtD n=1 Tax=Sneathiella sp. HT1-7 TaxID=2887192 RepID=UPI001D13C3DB|nr:VPLPA-CTERM-specific exosortase XrtD [Sneathiella sp. HT1-7]MCC3303891.1 VPLPA-CTERM-specific exosortase XrtD [Sneathiella sp. HT1-7]
MELALQRIDRTRLLLPVLLCLVFLIYIPDGLLLWDDWMNVEEFSHGPLMLAVALYLLWARRDLLSSHDTRGNWIGLVFCLISMAVYALAVKAGIENVRHLSLFLTILGLFVVFGGVTYGRYVLPSLILLPFVVPPPAFLNANLTYGLQLLSTDMSVALLRLAGISVYQDGNIIDMGTIKLAVVEACAGLRYLYPMIGLGVLLAMLFDIPLWKRALFVVIAGIVSIVMNSIRIFLTGAFAEWTDTAVSDGFFHLFEGWVFFLFSFAVMMVICYLTLNKHEKATLGGGVLKASVPAAEQTEKSVRVGPIVGALLLCAAFAPAIVMIRGIEPEIPDRKMFNSFPLRINDMIAEEDVLPKVEQTILNMSDYFLGHYRGGEVLPITLFIGYYDRQSAGSTPHSPRVCIPSGGWKIENLSEITLKNGANEVPVNRVLVTHGEDRLLVYYWFKQRGKYIANEYKAKFNLLLGGLSSARTDGSLIRLLMPIKANMTEAQADAELTAFSKELFKVLPVYVPD